MTNGFGNPANDHDSAEGWSDGLPVVAVSTTTAVQAASGVRLSGGPIIANQNVRRRANSQQIAKILKKVDAGEDVDRICQDAGVSIYTLQRWRKKYSGLLPSESERIKELERENMRLKRLVAELVRARGVLENLLSEKEQC